MPARPFVFLTQAVLDPTFQAPSLPRATGEGGEVGALSLPSPAARPVAAGHPSEPSVPVFQAGLAKPDRRRRAAFGRWRRALVTLAASSGGGLVSASGAIHLDLWDMGYRHVPTIGWLFLFQGIAGVLLGALIVIRRRIVPVASGGLFLAATIGGLLLSATVGIFGFHDHLDAPLAGASLAVEAAGLVVLLVAGALLWPLNQAARQVVFERASSCKPVNFVVRRSRK